ncbi:MAG: GNAT family N-acetyltransferase [Burkholderiales bacterium]|nr:GNAT family N-acetyltransferase [Burkholderiales bacterium]
MAITWGWYRLDDLTAREWHEVGCLRQSVFIVEQTCPFPDLDAADPDCMHLLGRDESGQLLAYLRLVPPGIKYPEASLGRIVTAPTARGTGIGRPLLLEGLAEHQRRYPGLANTIGAQARLEAFYQSVGFETISEPYDEDGIQHIDMRWAK